MSESKKEMSEKPPRKWEGVNAFLLSIMVIIGIFQIFQDKEALKYDEETIKQGEAALKQSEMVIKQGERAERDRAEQLRPRLSFQIHLEKVDDPVGFRLVSPIENGGTTTARRVAYKNYVFSDQPRQGSNYLSSIEVDWDNRKGHPIGDISPNEKNRKFTSAPLSPERLKTIASGIISGEKSFYVIARLEYCDNQDKCYSYTKCAEIGGGFVEVVAYCGTSDPP